MKIKGDPQWAMRRRIVITTLLYCAGLSTYAVSHSPEMATAVLPHTALGAFGIIGSYVFGAAWERVSGVPGGNAVTEQPTVGALNP